MSDTTVASFIFHTVYSYWPSLASLTSLNRSSLITTQFYISTAIEHVETDGLVTDRLKELLTRL